jgi:hypothetical protein
VLIAVLMLAGCSTANMNGSPQTSDAAANLPQPRTPDVFRKPPPQVGRWGYAFGYGGRY